ncbi:hypothetical protein CDAR_580601 [Caerostris darwini]|uniref:Uncharacterized protein n=1 Tax=Caerostris darwini TaxID=1538125 RepID=A0AAV4R7Z4_9ARAC|nr:hypothetical protein CDAR_580601 [Caerostris darwini]
MFQSLAQKRYNNLAQDIPSNMSKYRAGGYVAKKGPDIPVAPCQGWMDPCEFCDKRFGEWVEANKENIAKIPAKPGIFMLGLKHKNSVEFVDIIMDENDFQKSAFDRTDHARERIADKKSKVTKSVVTCR